MCICCKCCNYERRESTPGRQAAPAPQAMQDGQETVQLVAVENISHSTVSPIGPVPVRNYEFVAIHSSTTPVQGNIGEQAVRSVARVGHASHNSMSFLDLDAPQE